MRETRISLPELFLMAGTRILLGIGIGLLLSSKIRRTRRRAVGATLLGVGALSTIPLGLEVFGKGRLTRRHGERRHMPRQQATQPFAS